MAQIEYATVIVSTQSRKNMNAMLSREKEHESKAWWLMPPIREKRIKIWLQKLTYLYSALLWVRDSTISSLDFNLITRNRFNPRHFEHYWIGWIPGFDESNLPRVIGIVCGLLLGLNHILSQNSATPAQLRSEAVGLVLASIAVCLPFAGRLLKVCALSLVPFCLFLFLHILFFILGRR